MSKQLSSLPVGTLVKDIGTKYNGAPIVSRVLEHGHPGDPVGTTTLEGRDIISLKAFDAIEASNSDNNRKSYGNNRYLYSNLLQWLNSDKAAGAWYSAQHSADAAPTNANIWINYNEYDQEAGFLTNFSPELKAALQTVSKVTAKNTVTDGGGYETVSSKIFLLSNTEVGLANENNVAEGSIYKYYADSNNNARRVKKPTAQAVSNSEYTNSSLNANAGWYWWLRTPYSGYSYYVRTVYTDGSLSYNCACYGDRGVSPAYVLLSSLTVSDSPDTDGCYVLEWNASPVITTDSETLGDKNNGFSISYSISDPDGDAVGATILLDGVTKATTETVNQTQTYTYEVNNTTLRSLAEGTHTISIVATDSNGASTTKNITFNRVKSSVGLSGSDGSLGNIWLTPDLRYQVTDSGNTSVNVTEKIDGEVTNTIENVALDTNTIFDLSTFDNLTNETEHTIEIIAENADGNTASRTFTFNKLYKELSFYSRTIATDAAAKKIHVVADYSTEGDPVLKVEVTNNARAIQATWEDATAAVLAGEVYRFTNVPEDENEFGVAVKFTLTKSAQTERVYFNNYAFDYA